MFYMFMDHMFYIPMNMFNIMISMINYIIYVIIIMLIYGIKMIWKLPIILTVFLTIHACQYVTSCMLLA